MMILIILEGVVIAGLVVLVAGLLRSHAEILRRLHQLGAGDDEISVHLDGTRHRAAAPIARPTSNAGRATVPEDISGVTPDGRPLVLALRGSRGHTLLAFLSSGCGSCKTIWSALNDPHLRLPVDRIAIVTKSPDEESIGLIRDLAPLGATTVMSSDAWRSFEVPYTPYFAMIDAATGSMIGDGAAGSWTQVVSLVTQALADDHPSTVHTHDAPLRRTTTQRLEDSEHELRRAGIEPGDPVLYEKPRDGG